MTEFPTRKGYVLGPEWDKEKARLGALESMLDPGSQRLLGSMVKPGASCLEVGPGAGSMTRWLARAVGRAGRVVSVDLDTSLIGPLPVNVQPRVADVTEDSVGSSEYDVAHCRFVLEHWDKQRRENAINNVLSALRPGGFALFECHDHSTAWLSSPSHIAIDRTSAAIRAFFESAGADFTLGRHLPSALENAGFTDVHAEARASVVFGSSDQAGAFHLLLERIGAELISRGFLSDEDLRRATVASQDAWITMPLVVAAWGSRRQEEGTGASRSTPGSDGAFSAPDTCATT